MKDSLYRIETMKISDFPAVSRLWRNSEGIGLNESDTRPQHRDLSEAQSANEFCGAQG